MELEKRIVEHVGTHLEGYKAVVKDLYDHPEIGNEEFRSMEQLCVELEKAGFETERAFVVPTGFIGKYSAKKPGPTVAFLCEYDALPEVGHGCGHNLIAGMSLAAGCALKSIVDETGGSVWVVGTPAEENFGGKVDMANAGVFDDVDVAMMIHPGSENRLGARTLALKPVKYEFFGVNAHGCEPQNGKSALDAAVMSFVGINLLRQYVEPGTYIHGIVRDGGEAANVIPAYASLEYYFRGVTKEYVEQLAGRAEDCVKGACLAAGCTYKASVYECPYDDQVINYALCEELGRRYAELGLEDIEGVDETPNGSSDIGAVSYVCPALHGYIKIAGSEVNGHSKEMAAATISPAGDAALEKGAQALALVGLRALTDRAFLRSVKAEFEASVHADR